MTAKITDTIDKSTTYTMTYNNPRAFFNVLEKSYNTKISEEEREFMMCELDFHKTTKFYCGENAENTVTLSVTK